MKEMFLSIFILISSVVFAQLPSKEAYNYNVKQIHSGHSLTDPLFHPWPGQYRYLLTEERNAPWDNIGKSTIPGSPLKWRWNNSANVSPDARLDIADWEVLCITEGVPLFIDSPDLVSWEREGLAEQREYLSLFVNNAWNNGNDGLGAPTLLWTTWTNIDDSDGPWRELLDTYEAEWEIMQDSANANLPLGATPVYLIPGHRMMARLYDDIENDIVPGIDSLPQFFEDNIHVNHLGAYAVAMIHYACLFNESPVGLPHNLYADQNNNVHPSLELATYLQNMIWEVVTGYSERTGITPITTHIFEGKDVEKEPFIFPNPVYNELHISIKGQTQILNLQGQTIIKSSETIIDVSSLETGIYYVLTAGRTSKFQKI